MANQDNKVRWVNIRLSESEFQRLMKEFSKSTDLKMSSYARKLILGKPVKILYRNGSLDDFMEEIIRLRRELAAVGNNFNQLVKRINSVQQSPEVYLLSKYSRRIQDEILIISNKIKQKVENLADQWYQN